MSRMLVMLMYAPAVLSGCARAPGPDVSARVAPAAPVISRLIPDRGPAGEAYPVRVVIEGSGFAQAGNIVRFGPVTVFDLPSEEGGTRIVLFAPKSMPARGEAPPSPLLPGPYEVTVTTPEGTSDPARFVLESGGP